MVHSTLKIECATAMPNSDAGSSKSAGAKTPLISQNTARQTVVPITLKDRCTMAARLAFLFAPTEESMAVTQVPMFCPMMMGIAAP